MAGASEPSVTEPGLRFAARCAALPSSRQRRSPSLHPARCCMRAHRAMTAIRPCADLATWHGGSQQRVKQRRRLACDMSTHVRCAL